MKCRDTILGILGFVLPVLLAEGLIDAAEPHLPAPNSMPSAATRFKLAQVKNHADLSPTQVLFVGTSTTEVAIDPDILQLEFGLTAFNGAMPFGTPLANEVWIEEFLDPALSPSTVVIGVPTWTTRTDLETDRMRLLLVEAAHRSASGSLVQRVVSPSGLLSRQGLLLDPPQLYAEVRALNAGYWTARGHQTFFYNVDGAAVSVDQVVMTDGPVYSNENLDALRRLFRGLESRGKAVVLFIEPGGCPPGLSQCPTPELRAEAAAVLIAFAREAGIDVIDGRRFVGPEEAVWADPAHVNEEGTRWITRSIGLQLCRLTTCSPTAGDGS